jgi:glutathione S-transferase
MSESLVIVGAYSSPYSRKMRALLRFRRIPFRWVLKGAPEAEGLPKPAVDLVPVLVFPEAPDEAHIDSTPLIRRLEERYRGRSVIPPDPPLAFLDALIEDWADEWLTKQMFHFRWAIPEAAKRAGMVTVLEHFLHLDGTDLQEVVEAFSRRQVGRLEVVGSNPTTAPVIEESYRRTLQLLDRHLATTPFLMGNRPGTADFGAFGQLSQLVLFDQPSVVLASDVAPRVVGWVRRVEDLSWLHVSDDDWIDRDHAGERLRPILREIGRVYVPFLLANEDAVAEGLDRVECEIDGRQWVQRPFKYQAKCLDWLRARHTHLTGPDREFVDSALVETGCEQLFSNNRS